VKNNSSNTTKINYLKLTLRPQSEAFIRRSWYSVLPVLDTTERCRVKKAIIGVTELISALVPIHSVLVVFDELIFTISFQSNESVYWKIQQLLVVQCYSGSVTCLSISMDGSTLASGSSDATVRLWNTQSQQCIKVIQHAGLLLALLAGFSFSFSALMLLSEC